MGDFGHSMSFFPKFRPANRPPLGRESPRPAAFEVLAPERMVAMLANAVSAVYVMTEKTWNLKFQADQHHTRH